MSKKRRGGISSLISLRSAVTVISLLFGFTFLGWILTEIFPPDFTSNQAHYAAEWGSTAAKLSLRLRLYDPFHSFWYIGILGLFFVVLLACVLSRSRSLIARALSPVSTAGPSGNTTRDPDLGIEWGAVFTAGAEKSDPVAHYGSKYGKLREISSGDRRTVMERLLRILRRKGYSVWSREEEGSIFFGARAGGWRHIGTLVFHAGLLVITAGGMAGSILGSREMMYGMPGDVLPLYGNRHSIRVDDFQIITTPKGMIRDYVSRLTVLDSLGRVEKEAVLEVNHPLRVGGFTIYQSSYYADEDGFARAKIQYVSKGALSSSEVTVEQGKPVALADSVHVLLPGRFFPDFRVGPSGPYSASGMMRNPALEIHLRGPEGVETGYLLLRYPGFNSKFRDLPSIVLVNIEPLYYTGLEISRNPGAPLMLIGLFLSSLGLVAMYILDYRVIRGEVGRERLEIYRVAGRWKVSMQKEIAAIGERLRSEMAASGRTDKG